MVALTLWTIVYTVIPLYQKAVLDEEIAKKETTLRSTSAALERTYSEMRTYVVNALVDRLDIACTGLLIPPGPPTEKEEHPNFRERELAIVIPDCFDREIRSSTGIKNLRARDAETFVSQAKALAFALELEKALARRDYTTFDERAKKDPSIIHPVKGEFTLFAARGLPVSQRDDWLAHAAARESRDDIVAGFEHEAINRIRQLEKISWPVGEEK